MYLNGRRGFRIIITPEIRPYYKKKKNVDTGIRVVRRGSLAGVAPVSSGAGQGSGGQIPPF